MTSIFSFFLFLLVAGFLFSQAVKTKKDTLGLDPKSGSPSSKLPKLNEVVQPKFLNLSLLLTVIGFNLFLYDTFASYRTPVLGLGLFNLFLVGAVLLVINKAKHGKLTAILAGLSIFSGFSLILRANGFIQSVNTATMLGSLFLLIFVNTYDQITWKGLWFVKSFLKLIPHTFRQIPALLKKPKTEAMGKKLNVISILKTSILTIIVLVFFIGLLSSADPIFSQIIKDFKEEILERFFASLFIIAGVLIFLTQKTHSDKENYWRLGFFSFSDLFIPTLSLVTLFAVFLTVQANYLFGSEINLEAFDLTYSEYVRKGFIELLVTAFFGGLLSYLVLMKGRLTKIGKYVVQLKYVNAVLIFELFLMLGSALKRDLMYVEAYGLTRVRIIGGLFLFWLAGLLLLLLALNLYRKLEEKKFFMGLAALSVFVVASLNIVNIDQMVVNNASEHHDYKDYFYINNLSEDGYLGWKASVEDINNRVNALLTKDSLTDEEKSQLAGDKLSLISLQEKREDIMSKYAPKQWLLDNLCEELRCVKDKNSSSYADLSKRLIEKRNWRYYNWSEHKAYQDIFDNQYVYFNQVDGILNSIRFYQLRNNLDLVEEEKWFTSEFSYPFININLDYHPRKMTTYKTPKNVGNPFGESQIEIMNENKVSVYDLINGICVDSEKEVVIFSMMKSVEQTSHTIGGFDSRRTYEFAIWDDKKSTSKNISFYSFGNIPRDIKNSFDVRYGFNVANTNNVHFGKATFEVEKNIETSKCNYILTDWQEVRTSD